MKEVAFFTTSRAEFGQQLPLIKEAYKRTNTISPYFFIGGSHLALEYGNTKKEIEDCSEIRITDYFDFLLNNESNYSLARSLGIEALELASIFKQYHFDIVILFGDRYELVPILQNAILFKKLIIHIHGGEQSEGVIDEQIRHMITKAAHLHFVSCKQYARNVRKMGEEEKRIFITGALSVDAMKSVEKKQRKELFNELGLNENLITVTLTYHPVTNDNSITAIQQVKNIFNALKKFNLQVVITAPNVEVGREAILSELMININENQHYHFYESLGIVNYLNIVQESEFVIGNSSSGITEVPYYKIPTVDIGERQKGRLKHKSVIKTTYEEESIIRGINKALNKTFRKSLIKMEYLLGDGNSAVRMVDIIESLKNLDLYRQKKLDFP